MQKQLWIFLKYNLKNFKVLYRSDLYHKFNFSFFCSLFILTLIIIIKSSETGWTKLNIYAPFGEPKIIVIHSFAVCLSLPCYGYYQILSCTSLSFAVVLNLMSVSVCRAVGYCFVIILLDYVYTIFSFCCLVNGFFFLFFFVSLRLDQLFAFWFYVFVQFIFVSMALRIGWVVDPITFVSLFKKKKKSTNK